jgi:predicted N-acyltransferase
VKDKSVFIQFRNFNSQEENKEIFLNKGFQFRERLNLVVDTRDLDTVKRNMSESRLRQVRKGLGLGAECIAPENLQQVRDFYDILHNLYKFKIKKPLPARDFFERFYHLSVEGKAGIIRLVKYQDRIIGGILAPVTPGKTIYEWYVCGLDHEYRQVHPSVLATWSAIEYAIENGIPSFDFMGVGIPERDYGVRDFKMRFGGDIVNYGRFARINNKLLYFTAETGYNLLALFKKI